MKKRIFFLLTAMCMTLTSWAQTPTESYLAAKYDVVNNVVLCMYFDVAPCTGVVVTGSFNGWSDDLANCPYFSQLPGYEGWWAVEIPYSEGLNAKPICLDLDGQFNWDNQCGGPDAWSYIGGSKADIVYGAYDEEADVSYPSAGAYIYELVYWKQYREPCDNKLDYTINLYAPSICEGQVPVISGGFNSWDKSEMTQVYDGAGKEYWTYTVTAAQGTGFKFRLNEDQNWETQLQYWDGYGWSIFNNFYLGSETTVNYDLSDGSLYRFGTCWPVTITVLVPSDCGVPTDDGMWLSYFRNWDEYEYQTVQMAPLEGRKYQATFNAPSSEYYGFFVMNKASRYEEDVVCSNYIYYQATNQSCWEMDLYHDLFQDETCSATDHNCIPTNLKATPLGRDSILFEWEAIDAPEGEDRYTIYCYDEKNNILFRWFASSDDRSIRVKAGVGGETTIDHWIIAIGDYAAQGEGFTIPGDERLPHSLQFIYEDNDFCTITWEGSSEIHHYAVYLRKDGVYATPFDTEETMYQLDLEGASSLDVTITAKDADGNELGSVTSDRKRFNICFYPPALCDDVIPAVTGKFNNWGITEMHADVDDNNKSCFKCTVFAEDATPYKFCGNNGTYQMRYKYNGGWIDVDDSYFRSSYYGNEVTTDYSNILQFRLGPCEPPVLEQVKATVLVPTDAGMDISNGMWVCWWPGENSEYDDVDKHYEPMTPIGGNKFEVTFAPNHYAYGYFFINAENERVENRHRTYSRYQMTATEKCYEVIHNSGDSHNILDDADCSRTDHDYRPKDLKAENIARDTVLLSWNIPNPERVSVYVFYGWDSLGNRVFYRRVTSSEITDNSYRLAVRNAEPKHVATWNMGIVYNLDGYGIVEYYSDGEPFDVVGDTRIPRNLAVYDDGDGKYTLRWDGDPEVHHYRVYLNKDTVVTETSCQFTLEDNKYYSVTVYAFNEDESVQYGYIYNSFNTNVQEPRDLTMRFYLPKDNGFIGEAGGALKWRDATFVGDHIIALEPDAEAHHWYSAVIKDFKRNSVRISLLNAPTAEQATAEVTYNYTIAGDEDFAPASENEGKWTLYSMAGFYPHDYKPFDLQLTQEYNRLKFAWAVKDTANEYSLYAYKNGERLFSTWRYANDGLEYTYTLNNTEEVTITWYVSASPNWNEHIALRAYGEPFIAAPSPFLPKNLKAVDNNDGTFTFSWSPAESDSVKMYTLQVYDPAGSQLIYEGSLNDTIATRPMTKMFSGTYLMRVGAYSKEGRTYLGEREQEFVIAPAPEHDINIRILINPCSGYDTSAGVKFYIADKPDNYILVDATPEQYGWWSYKLTTDQYGTNVQLENGWSSAAVYGDVCLEYLDRDNLVDAYCDARASDYMPHHLAATPNGDGTYTLTWLVDLTERVDHYTVRVYDASGNQQFSTDVKEMQAKTSILRLIGDYRFTVDVYENRTYKQYGYEYRNDYKIGTAVSLFTVEPVEEREIVIRVLEQPMDEYWSVYLRVDSLNSYKQLEVQDEEDNTRWCRTSVTSTDPAILIVFLSRYNNQYSFTIAESTCFEVDKDFHVASCDAKAKSYELTNMKVDNPGNGRVTFSWDCPNDPDMFYFQALSGDTVPLFYIYLNGANRSVTTTLNNDSAMNFIWYMVPIKVEQAREWNAETGEYETHDYNMWMSEFTAYGEPFRAEEPKYVPKNLAATPNANATWTISWDAVPAPVTNYQIRIANPDGQNNYYYSITEPRFVTDVLWRLGTYQAYVYSIDDRGVQYGWQYINFEVAEAAEYRDVKVRLLIHPDLQREAEDMSFQVTADSSSVAEPLDEQDGWYSYSFQTKMPATKINLLGYTYYVSGDTCFEYVNGIRGVECDAIAHDYRIVEGSLKAEVEPGKVTLSWSGVEKADEYYVELYYLNGEEDYYWWREYITEAEVNDTTYTYLVPDYLDGKKLTWCVRPTKPHNISRVWATEYTPLQKNVILLSDLEVSTEDSISYHFTWKCNTDTVRYEVQINTGYYTDPIYVAQVATPDFDYSFITAALRYRWQVRAVNEAGEPLSLWVEADEWISAKSGLRAITNLHGEAQERTVLFTWDSPVSKARTWLYYQDMNYGWYQVFDSIVDGHSLSYETTKDGRYVFEIRPYIEYAEGQWTELSEYKYAYVNVFTTKTFHVEVSATTGGSIYNNPTGDYPEGYRLWMEANPNEHYQFVRWSDGVEDSYREIIVTSDTTLIALFEQRAAYTLTLDAAEGGTIRISGEEESVLITHLERVFEQGESMWCQAEANDGYAFYGWSDGVTDVSRYIYITSDTTVTAMFRPICYATITAGEGGRVQVSDAYEYDRPNKRYGCLYGEALAIKANPDEGYRFIGWSDGDKNVSRSVIITSDTVITASFEKSTDPIKQFIVRVLSENTEMGEVNPISGTYNEGDQLTIIATPKEHSLFVQWSDGEKDATRVITVTADTTLIASFDYKKVRLTIRAGEGGTVNDSTANGTYNYGMWVNISATPDEHYQFVGWSDGNTSSDRGFELKQDLELTAIFAIEQYLVTFLNADGSYIESHNYNYGETPVCSERPTLPDDEAFHYVFKGWSPEITIVTGNAVYTAVYEKVPKEPQGIDEMNATTEDDAHKIIYNGAFYIIKNARIYNAQGQLVK